MIWQKLRRRLALLVRENDLDKRDIAIQCAPLSPEEAIGRPEHGDYVLQKGRERIVEASLADARGHAFSDTFGEWSGTAGDLLAMELAGNFRRAVFVSSLNAIMRHLGLIERSAHCRDDGPVRCGRKVVETLCKEFPPATRIALVGYQPRICENLAQVYRLSVLDMDADNIGEKAGGGVVLGLEGTDSVLADAEVVVAPTFQGEAISESPITSVLVEQQVLIEVSAIYNEISAADRRIVQTYLKLTGAKLGLIGCFSRSALVIRGVVPPANGD